MWNCRASVAIVWSWRTNRCAYAVVLLRRCAHVAVPLRLAAYLDGLGLLFHHAVQQDEQRLRTDIEEGVFHRRVPSTAHPLWLSGWWCHRYTPDHGRSMWHRWCTKLRRIRCCGFWLGSAQASAIVVPGIVIFGTITLIVPRMAASVSSWVIIVVIG